MSDVTDTIKSVTKEGEGFINYITTFNNDHKNEIMNIIQYSVLAIIPVMLILKSVKSLVPEDDESKGCLEISMECVLQIIFIMVSIWLTNRLIRYVPTYSKVEYSKFVPENFIIPLLIILATMQSKLGFKLNILMDRAIDLWHGKSSDTAVKNSPSTINSNNVNPMNIKTTHQDPNYILPTTESYANPNRRDSNGQIIEQNNGHGNNNLLGSTQTGVFPHKSCGIGGDIGSVGASEGVHATTIEHALDEPIAANMGIGSPFGSSF